MRRCALFVLVLLAVICSAMLSSFSEGLPPGTSSKNDTLKVMVPQGWPKPVYDFAKNPVTAKGFELGRKLFFDPRLSKDSTISCASCHLQFTNFTHVDHALSHGILGKKGTRNT